jgi:hypothetical protein
VKAKRKAMFSLLPVEFRQSAIEGRGVFAKRAFVPGEVIVAYAPKHVRLAADDPRATEAAATRLTLFAQDGCVLVPEQSTPGGWLCNHSCAPNAALFSSGDGRVQCIRPIARGEEVTIFYGWVTSNGDGSAPCRCGAPGCRGAINFDVTDEDAAKVRVEDGVLVTTDARVRAKLEEYAEFLQSIGQEHVQRTVASALARLKDQPKGV